MSDNTNPSGSVDTSVNGAANAFMSILEPRNEEAQADPEVRASDDSAEYAEEGEFEQSDLNAEETES